MVTYNDVDYFYVYNLQGDVVALIDANGTQVVEYGYDVWGNPISKTGSLAATIGVSVYILPEWMTGTVRRKIFREERRLSKCY